MCYTCEKQEGVEMWLERDEDSMTTGHRTLQRGSCKVSPELTVPLISRQTPDLGNAIVAGLSEEAVEEDKLKSTTLKKKILNGLGYLSLESVGPATLDEGQECEKVSEFGEEDENFWP
ncbi:unnamed protein product [Rangifer tarandus platyrhynchus]|uniref:Uncharacterized protein n=1 Tax=Rangifer tarandus platyrhynchus TaxID=3082113 RepID=A0ABN8YK74_RANTA|nr:unnamed protein product [Rangifer tarandus platyrhynchus]